MVRLPFCKGILILLVHFGRGGVYIGGSKGGRGTHVPLDIQILRFHAVLRKFWQNHMLVPIPQGNPGSATASSLGFFGEGVGGCLGIKKLLLKPGLHITFFASLSHSFKMG